MVPAPCSPTAPVSPPAYQRALAKRRPAVHIDALDRVTRLPHRLSGSHCAVWRCTKPSATVRRPCPRAPAGRRAATAPRRCCSARWCAR
jgi:hypothetical protein